MNTVVQSSFSQRVRVWGCAGVLVLSFAACKSGGGPSDLRVELAQTKLKVTELETTQADTLKKLQYNMDELQRQVDNQRKATEDGNANIQAQIEELRKAVAKNASPAGAGQSGNGAPGVSAPNPPAGGTSEEQERVFQKANQAYSLGKYPEAIDLYTSFLFDYRDSPKAPNAAYELGRCYFSSNDFEKGQRAFRYVLDTYPTSSIIPDSMISLAMCQIKLTKYKEARETIKTLQTRYPDYNPDMIKTILSQIPPA
ncbi:MAG TPA: tetratricopeptide repeat protein [Candidatus Sumerlaeota bacterium]|nr:tetratricopeptide repeat protein [Candidatus Sumerlaeota bacterium]HPS03028.1 tetratricopeptide repeat protein [Candidatus Sumerlaeota bacterium]